MCFFFFFNDTATTEIYTLSLQRRSSDLSRVRLRPGTRQSHWARPAGPIGQNPTRRAECSTRSDPRTRSEEHTSELQSRQYLVCRLLLEKKMCMAYYTIEQWKQRTPYLLH